eukprot:273280-Amphidinium_carterae.1
MGPTCWYFMCGTFANKANHLSTDESGSGIFVRPVMPSTHNMHPSHANHIISCCISSMCQPSPPHV